MHSLTAAMDSRASDDEKKDCVEKAVAIVMKHAVSAIEKKNGVPTMEGCVAVFAEHGQKWLEEYLKDSSLVKLSIIGWKLVLKRDVEITSSKQMEGVILQSLKEITAVQPRGATIDDLMVYVEAAYRMPDSLNSLKLMEVQLKCGVETLKSWNKVLRDGAYLTVSPVVSEEGNLGTVDKSMETDNSNVGSKKEQFWRALEKAYASGFVTEEVYKGIKYCAEQRRSPDSLVQHKNRIVLLRKPGKLLVKKVKAFLKGRNPLLGIRTSMAYLLWNEEVLDFLSSIPLMVDEEAKAEIHKVAEDEVQVWLNSLPRKEIQVEATTTVVEETPKARKYDKEEIKEFKRTLSKARRDGSITEEAYQAVRGYCDKRAAHRWIVRSKNKSILPNTRKGKMTLERLKEFSTSTESIWPSCLAFVYLLWSGEVLQFAEGSGLFLDQAAKTALYQGAQKTVLDWSLKNLQLEPE